MAIPFRCRVEFVLDIHNIKFINFNLSHQMVSSLPMLSKLCAIGITPVVETRSCEGRKPRIPQYDAGALTLPPVSLPMIEITFCLNLLRKIQET